jgi:hypothetical protein
MRVWGRLRFRGATNSQDVRLPEPREDQRRLTRGQPAALREARRAHRRGRLESVTLVHNAVQTLGDQVAFS